MRQQRAGERSDAVSIEVKAVTKRFGDFVALDGVDLTVTEGRLTALLGPSGGGKSTLLRIIGGLEDPDDGAVFLGGENVTAVPARRRNVGFVFQHYAAFRHLTVRRNVAFGLEIRKLDRNAIRRRVDELLHLVHLDQFADRLPSQLSGGQRQRMALARALAVQPRVLLLDEPFGALDAAVRRELREWLRRLHDEAGVTTLLVTHDQEEALEAADELVVINQGRIEQAGTPEEVYSRPANEFVMTFLGPVTRFAGAVVRPHDIEVHAAAVDGSVPATVQRLDRLGFEVRVRVSVQGEDAWVQLAPREVHALRLRPGDHVWLRVSA